MWQQRHDLFKHPLRTVRICSENWCSAIQYVSSNRFYQALVNQLRIKSMISFEEGSNSYSWCILGRRYIVLFESHFRIEKNKRVFMIDQFRFGNNNGGSEKTREFQLTMQFFAVVAIKQSLQKPRSYCSRRANPCKAISIYRTLFLQGYILYRLKWLLKYKAICCRNSKEDKRFKFTYIEDESVCYPCWHIKGVDMCSDMDLVITIQEHAGII